MSGDNVDDDDGVRQHLLIAVEGATETAEGDSGVLPDTDKSLSVEGGAAATTLEIIQKKNIVQAELIEKLQQQLNESQVKHSKEAYWLRLELDSSRREKEAVEDRMAELYNDVQEILGTVTATSHHDARPGAANKNAVSDSLDVCTEPDYVVALQDRLTAYERSVEILNRQVAMLKTSSDAVVASMKQEVSDLIEEKSLIEMDLLNQISSLHCANSNLEIELSERLASIDLASKTGEPFTTEETTNETRALQSPVSLGPAFDQTLEEDQGETKEKLNNAIDLPCEDGNLELGASAVVKTETVHDSSFRSTATTLGSSFTNDGFSPLASSLLGDMQIGLQQQHHHQQSIEIQTLHGEVAKWKSEAACIAKEKLMLQEKLEEITTDLMFTKSSANVALTLDKIETDRAETLAHLDRITVLWDRADCTIQVIEALLSELQPKPVQQGGNSDGAGKFDRERLLSTLETATLVHGQIKMSLMLIELTFRNHLTCIQNDNLQQQQNDRVLSDRLEKVRSETLAAISEVENKWTRTMAQMEKRILSDKESIYGSVQKHVGELQKAQAIHHFLEQELHTLRHQTLPKVQMTTMTTSTDDAHPECAEVSLKAGSHGPNCDPQISTGIIVSHGVLFRLQKEILSAVEGFQKKNELIRRLIKTVERQKKREEVLQKELKRASQKSHSKGKKKDGIDLAKLNQNRGMVDKKPKVVTASQNTKDVGKKDGTLVATGALVEAPPHSSCDEVGMGESMDQPLLSRSASARRKKGATMMPDRGWSSL